MYFSRYFYTNWTCLGLEESRFKCVLAYVADKILEKQHTCLDKSDLHFFSRHTMETYVVIMNARLSGKMISSPCTHPFSSAIALIFSCSSLNACASEIFFDSATEPHNSSITGCPSIALSPSELNLYWKSKVLHNTSFGKFSEWVVQFTVARGSTLPAFWRERSKENCFSRNHSIGHCDLITTEQPQKEKTVTQGLVLRTAQLSWCTLIKGDIS